MDRPILMNAAMVRAVLAGQKTQTRRTILPAPEGEWVGWRLPENRPTWETKEGHYRSVSSPVTGDRLWVRETWDWRDWQSGQDGKIRIAYAADGEQVDRIAPPDWNPTIYNAERWRPSIHMPRWASRITLPLVSMRVERVQDISEADVWAEGITVPLAAEVSGKNWADIPTLHDAWREVWVSIYGQSSWDANPWVWVAEWNKAEVVR